MNDQRFYNLYNHLYDYVTYNVIGYKGKVDTYLYTHIMNDIIFDRNNGYSTDEIMYIYYCYCRDNNIEYFSNSKTNKSSVSEPK